MSPPVPEYEADPSWVTTVSDLPAAARADDSRAPADGGAATGAQAATAADADRPWGPAGAGTSRDARARRDARRTDRRDAAGEAPLCSDFQLPPVADWS